MQISPNFEIENRLQGKRFFGMSFTFPDYQQVSAFAA